MSRSFEQDTPLAWLRENGFSVRMHGGRVRVSPRAEIPEERVPWLREHQAEIILGLEFEEVLAQRARDIEERPDASDRIGTLILFGVAHWKARGQAEESSRTTVPGSLGTKAL